jgi:hypothetical protein
MKLPTERRNQLIGIIAVTAAALVVIWFLFVNPRYATLRHSRKVMADKQHQLQLMDQTVKNIGDTANQLQDASTALEQAEADVASGDPNAWIYDLIRHSKENYKVDISISGQAGIGDENLFPQFPYKQLQVSVSGSAYYHDLGNFIANFENTYPHIRLVNLTIDPGAGPDEKLSFHMDIMALMKGNP